MDDILHRLKTETAGTNAGTAAGAAAEIESLRARVSELETILLVLVRTGWPWDSEGEPTEVLRLCRDGYGEAMKRARATLGLDRLSAITRTEPRT